MEGTQAPIQNKLAVLALVVSLTASIVTVAMAWGRMSAVQETVTRDMEKKLDTAIFTLYLSQSDKRMESIDRRLTEIQQSIDMLKDRRLQ